MPLLRTHRHHHPLLGPMAGLVVAMLCATGLAGPSSAVPVAAAANAVVSGLVTGAGLGLANVWVTLTPVDSTGTQVGDPTRTITDQGGRYEFRGLPVGHAKLHVRAPLAGGLVDTFWPAAYRFAAAGILDLGTGPARADIDLAHGGSVSGVVVDSVSGAPVPDAQVTATILGPSSSGPVGSAESVEGAGRFAISGLPPVQMLLFVRLPPESSYLSPPYGSGSPREDLRIDGAQATVGMIIRVGRGAEIRGTVRDETGTPVPGAEVEVTGCRPACPRPVPSDDSGSYRITAIPPGSALRVVAWEGLVGARVRRLVDPDEGPATGLLPQWYSGKVEEEDATLVNLRAGDVRSLDFRLIRGAFVTVQVLGAGSDLPLSGVIAQLKPADDPYARHFAQRDPDDPTKLRMGPVAPGRYLLRVVPGSANPDYLAVTPFVDEAAAPAGFITLEAGDRVNLAVRLPARPQAPAEGDDPTSTPVSDASDGDAADDASPGLGGLAAAGGLPGLGGLDGPKGSGAWPGLAAGFLAARTG